MKHKKMSIDFLNEVDYCFMLIISSFHLLGSARDDKICEDELHLFSVALFHFIEPILEETKEYLHAYIELLNRKGKKRGKKR